MKGLEPSTFKKMVLRVGVEPTVPFRSRITSPVQSTSMRPQQINNFFRRRSVFDGSDDHYPYFCLYKLLFEHHNYSKSFDSFLHASNQHFH